MGIFNTLNATIMKQTIVVPALSGYPYRKTQLNRSVRKNNIQTSGEPETSSFQQRIDDLRDELTQLNLYDHPMRIVEICKEIQSLRAALKKL
jgi:hypothetical protein